MAQAELYFCVQLAVMRQIYDRFYTKVTLQVFGLRKLDLFRLILLSPNYWRLKWIIRLIGGFFICIFVRKLMCFEVIMWLIQRSNIFTANYLKKMIFLNSYHTWKIAASKIGNQRAEVISGRKDGN